MPAVMERSDEQLLAVYSDETQTSAARHQAFHDFVDRYRRRVYGVCLQVLGDPADAEDAAQETFLKVARHAEGFRADAAVSTWIYRIARNACTDLIRRQARRPQTPVADVTVVAEDATAPDAIGATETGLVLRQALGQLDELSRQLLLLVAVEGLSYAEAAAATDLAVGTVKSRVSRARVRLGELLVEQVRRGHPMQGDGRLIDGIKAERDLLGPLRSDGSKSA